MSAEPIGRPADLGADRGDLVVCILVESAWLPATASLRSLLLRTPPPAPIVICSCSISRDGLRELLREAIDPLPTRIHIVGHSEPSEGGSEVAAAIAAAAPADVVLVAGDCLVADGWLEGLAGAAHDDAAVATARPLLRGDPGKSDVAADGRPLEEVAGIVAQVSLRLNPRIGAAGGPCLYVRRSAIELLEGSMVQSLPGEPEFSERCLQSGLIHVLADGVIVQAGHEAHVLEDRGASLSPAVARAVGAARRATAQLSVVVDARALRGPVDGTHVQVLELIAALARSGEVGLTAIVPDALDARTAQVLAGFDALTVARVRDGAAPPSWIRGDVVHRPFQVSTPADLTFLSNLSDRMVVTHQDLLSYNNPSYFRSPSAWQGYRELTRRALAAADCVAFVSAHARDAAVAEELVERHRTTVVHNGVDHSVSTVAARTAPRQADVLPADAPVMLCLGTDFRHKNRVFALRILHELQNRYGWSGWLVMAGPHVATGSSLAEEREMLEADAGLAKTALYLGAVNEAEKNWLLARASLVLYPTVHEGFGLIPFEAADHGVPCLWAPGTSLSEVLPDESAGIVAWDPQISARCALKLMQDSSAGLDNLRAIRDAAAPLSWDATARLTLEMYRRVCIQPANPTSVIERAGGLMQRGLSEDAMRLVGPDGALPPELERPLLALATHPRLAAPVLGAIKLAYRARKRSSRRQSSGG